LSILLAYSKMQVFQALLDSDLPDQEYLQLFLKQYFPEQVQARYGAQVKNHPLKREIIATMVTNRVVDQAGCTFVNTLVRQAGATIIEAISAYLLFDEVLDGMEVRRRIMAADNKMASTRQYELLLALERALAGLCRQAIEQGLPVHLDKACINTYRKRLTTFRQHLEELLPAEEWQVCKDAAGHLAKEGFPVGVALDMTSLRYLVGFLPAVSIAESTGADLLAVTTAMARMRQQLRLSEVMGCLNDYSPHDRWDRMALASLQGAFIRQTVSLTQAVVERNQDAPAYLAAKRQRLDYYLGLLDSLKTAPPTSTSPFMVLLRALEAIGD